MSRSVSIDFQCASKQYQSDAVLLAFLSSGWTLNDYGNISFLPLNDNNQFDWNIMPYSEENIQYLFTILNAKNAANELIGIALQWQDTGIGIEILLWNDAKISVNPSINRCTLSDGSQFTSVDWYLERIIPVLRQANISIEAVTWNEHV